VGVSVFWMNPTLAAAKRVSFGSTSRGIEQLPSAAPSVGSDSITFVITKAIMTALKITQIGNSLGLILPKEILARLKLQKGDSVFVTDTPDGVAITPYDPVVAEQLALGSEFMHDYRETFRELAK
jgi:putative addiction module antidote